MMHRPLNKLVFFVLICGLFSLRADGQALIPDISRQLQQATQGTEGSSPFDQSQQPTVILEPTGHPNPPLPTSRLEQILSARAGTKLTQFGYQQLGVGREITIPQAGSVQDNYVLGPGDQIVVTLRGQENAEYRVTVNRDGQVVLPRMYPVSASGRTFGDFRRELEAAIHRAYISTEGFVSVGRVRQISVMVSGEVNSPGTRILNGLSTPVDAILVSGGIKKSGSLRNIYVIRGDKRFTVDLYSVLTGEEANHVSLADGDQIVVPSLGPTVAVAGWVRHPAIYEMKGGRSAISVPDLLKLAGGLVVRGKYLFSLIKTATDGRTQMTRLDGINGEVEDGDILVAQLGVDKTVNRLTLSGGTPLAGQYSVRNTKLSEILKAPGAMGDNPYTLLGIISRRDPVTLLRTLTAFTPVAVLRGSEDMDVQSDDIVRVLSARESRMLFQTVREYEHRRDMVDEDRLNPEQRIVPNMTTPIASTATSVANPYAPGGATATSPQLAQPAVENQEPYKDLSSETEDESLAYVERNIRLAELKVNGPLVPSYYGQNTAAVQGQNVPPYLAMSQGTSLAQNNCGLSDVTGCAGNAQANTMLSQQYLPQAIPQPQQIGPYRDPRSSYEPPTLGQNLQEQQLDVGQVPTNQGVTSLSDLARQLEIAPVAFVNFLRDHKVMVDGAVQDPGLYLVGPDADIQSLLQAAGGLARWANKNSVEVISASVDMNSAASQTRRRTVSLADAGGTSYIISPRDEVHVGEIFTNIGVGHVVVQGQVRDPGMYQLTRGEHLSDLLMRAGGLTESAYPYGTVFLRRAVAAQEKVAFNREADEIESQLLIAMSRRDPLAKLAPDAFTAVQGYVNQLRTQKALGRVTVVADPVVLAAQPSRDPLLEPGDVVFVPQRPFSVSVLGEVLQPGSIPYNPNMSASDYIDRAGGYSQFADSSQTILVLPDGTARRIGSMSWFRFSRDDVPPGSVIYVARDISGIDLQSIAVSTASIFSTLATSAAALAVLSKQ